MDTALLMHVMQKYCDNGSKEACNNPLKPKLPEITFSSTIINISDVIIC